ncbi:MAG: T9SS type A sorting domain-containing protein [Flavobacteriales bacterium]|nr:T9SS type A sorting domain-containing protein [Flavobacteriales bacterium]MBK6883285.1 T9SS type A sorting domain-containing protein [Flavobacteriales bacterium]MBK7113963.1 T9SS type A sorting domain-containing protein [Flavobacteriales bacterium]MBK8531278.1 T9SS type A sorting domain-containing protein [Flavobacteriales bacterium]MBK8708531.1 T9SS type A sorting domain-containing protein [Flavobacteriales bacterium]
MKADSLAEVVWAKHFDNNGSFQFIRELPGGDLLAGINMDSAGAVVARMDAEGNFLWCKSYIRPKGMVHDVVIESDDAFIITGFTDSVQTTNPFAPLPPSFQPKLFMMKLNGAGEVQWCKGYEGAPNLWSTQQPSRIERGQDGNYVVLATVGAHTDGVNYNFFQQPFLMKADQNGDTLWTRSVASSNYAYYTNDLLAYSDGGYLFSGGIWGELPEMNSGLPYIFKTDSLGHFSCQEVEYPVVITDLFPMDSSFVLTSVDGATAHEATVIDTTFSTLHVYDACLITGLSAPDIERYERVHLRPNPNSGRFTLTFPDPLQAESYYSVYDTMGKLLFQRRLPTGATQEEVDLSGFSPGTYVLRFTDRDGVCYERVVLE